MVHSQESNSTLTSRGSQKTVVSRTQSDSSTISSSTNQQAAAKANISMDNINTKNRLLKLSLLNSTNSPMKCQLNDTALAESVFAEAKKIAKQFADSRESSFEDLNNVSQPFETADTSFVDPDLQAMRLKVPVVKVLSPQSPTTKPSAEKIAEFQEQLKRIKKEVDSDDNDDYSHETKYVPIELTSTPIKVEAQDDEDSQSELDRLLNKLRSVITDGNKDEAKRHLNRLNELLEKQKDQGQARNTVNVVQPIVRQATFDIDPVTGQRNYEMNKVQTQKTENDDIVEKLTKLLGRQSLNINIHSIKTGGEKIVVVLPEPVKTTPEKNSLRINVPKAYSAVKAIDCKKLGTPMKRLSQASRPGLFSTPRPQTTSKKTNPYEQKLGVPTRTGAVRKSLMNSINESPQKSKAPNTPRPNPARRSVSMKASIPAVQVTKSSPMKHIPRPSTGAPYGTNKRLSTIPGAPSIKGRPSTSNVPSSSRPRTFSDQKKPVSQFKAPSALRKAQGVDKNQSLV